MPPVPDNAPPPRDTQGPTPPPDSQFLAQAMQLLGDRLAVATGAVSAEVAALSALTREIGEQNKAPAAPPKLPGPPKAEPPGMMSRMGTAVAGQLSGMVGMLTGTLTSALSPVALLGQAIGSQTSGVSVFMKSLQLTGTVLAGFLMPVFVTLAGTVLALTGYLDGLMDMDFLEAFFGAAFENIKSTFEGLAAAIDPLVTAFGDLGVTSRDVGKALGLMILPVGAMIELMKKIGLDPATVFKMTPVGMGLEALKEAGLLKGDGDKDRGGFDAGKDFGGGDFGDKFDKDKGKGKGAKPGDPKAGREERKGFMGEMAKGMQMALTSLRNSIGPPAAYTSPEERYRSVQLAQLNTDPIEQKMLEVMLKQLDAMNRILGLQGNVVRILGHEFRPAVGP